jgi:transposase
MAALAPFCWLAREVRAALLSDPEGLPAHLERVLMVLETLREQITEADRALRILAQADDRMPRLMTVPGVGPVTSARFVAALDDVNRFHSAASGLVSGPHPRGEDDWLSDQAHTALARKLAHVLYAMWKHETTYDPARAARPLAA